MQRSKRRADGLVSITRRGIDALVEWGDPIGDTADNPADAVLVMEVDHIGHMRKDFGPFKRGEAVTITHDLDGGDITISEGGRSVVFVATITYAYDPGV